MSPIDQTIHCPIQGIRPFTPCPIEEVQPIVDYLLQNRTVEAPIEFPRGTLLPDGRLDMCKQSLGPEGCRQVVRALKHNRFVKSVLLGTNGIGDEGASAVRDLIECNSSLQIVYLGCNGISETGVIELAKGLAKSQIRGLWLKRNPIGDKGIEALVRALSRCNSLRVLDLVNTGLGKYGIEAIAEWLNDVNCPIQRLYLGGNGLEADSMESLASVLTRNKTLKGLYLNVNQLGDVGVSQLMRGLEQNDSLLELGLASNGIASVGASMLLQMIQNHPTLTNLDVGYSLSTKVLDAKANCFGDEGGLMVAEVLQANSVLRRLNLNKTEIGALGRQALAESILANQTLVQCDIDGGWSAEVRAHLLRNELDHGGTKTDDDRVLIRSVYRTGK